MSEVLGLVPMKARQDRQATTISLTLAEVLKAREKDCLLKTKPFWEAYYHHCRYR